MPETTRPNLVIPSVLWGEVKVAAYRSGKSVNEVVVGVLEKAFKRGVVEEQDTTGSARGMRDLRAVEADDSKSMQVSNPAPSTKCVHDWVFRNGKRECMLCGEKP